MLECFEDLKNKTEVMAALEELDHYVIEAIGMAGISEDPTVGYREGLDLLGMAFDELPCTTIKGMLKGSLFNILKSQVQRMMRELAELQKNGDDEQDSKCVPLRGGIQ